MARTQEILGSASASTPERLMLTRDAVRPLMDHRHRDRRAYRDPSHSCVPSERRGMEGDSGVEAGTEDAVGRSVDLFAYPNGRPGADYGSEHVRMVREAGFTAAFTTAWGAASAASDAFQLPRFTPWSRSPLEIRCPHATQSSGRRGAEGGMTALGRGSGSMPNPKLREVLRPARGAIRHSRFPPGPAGNKACVTLPS